MTPKIIKEDKIILTGMSFYGDPFTNSSSWTEENEIGRLWQRFKNFLEKKPKAIKNKKNPEEMIEVHLIDESTYERGEYEVFVGTRITKIENIPLECAVKILPATDYAVFTLKGNDITNTDWWQKVYNEWLPAEGYEISYNFSFQSYTPKFKGIDKLEKSELDFYFPVKKINKQAE